MRAIDRWWRLTRDEKMLAARTAAAVVAMSVGVRVFGIKRMIRGAENQGKSSSCAGCADIVTAVERAGRYVPGGT